MAAPTAIETFNKINTYVGSVASKMGKVGGKVADCVTAIDWSDLWTGPKVPLAETFANLKTEAKKLWDRIVGIFKFRPGPDSVQAAKVENEGNNRRRRQVQEK